MLNTEIEKELKPILVSGDLSDSKDKIEKFSIANPVFNRGKNPQAIISVV